MRNRRTLSLWSLVFVPLVSSFLLAQPAEIKTADQPETKPATEPNAATRPAAEKKDDRAAVPANPKSSQSQSKKGERKVVKPELAEKKLLPNIGSLKHPMIPGQPWRIHDLKRPRPPVVTPGVIDSMPPSDAIVLFDGENLDEWYQLGSEDEVYEAPWKVKDGYFEIEPRTGSITTLESFGSCQLHIEWFIPEGTTGTSQGRGNSGVKMMERYEIQILDSFKNRTYADGQAASIYGQYPPLVNANRQQGEWQTYEIFFEAPNYEAGELKRPPMVTVVHNGILVQHHREVPGPTGLRGAPQEAIPPAAPIMLQDHGNRIRFRNIWIRPL